MKRTDLTGYIIFSWIVTTMIGIFTEVHVGPSVAFWEGLGILIEVPTMGAFIIGAIYLFGSKPSENREDSVNLPESKGEDREEK